MTWLVLLFYSEYYLLCSGQSAAGSPRAGHNSRASDEGFRRLREALHGSHTGASLRSLQGSIDDFSINLFEATILPIWKMWERAFACFTVPVLNCNISCKCRNACEREWLYQLWAAAVRHCATVKSQSSVLHPLDTHVPIIPAWHALPWCCKVWSSWSILSNHESASDWDWDLKTSADQISWCRPGRAVGVVPGSLSGEARGGGLAWTVQIITTRAYSGHYPHLTHWHWSRGHGTPDGNELE